MALEFKDHHDIVALIAELLAKRCFDNAFNCYNKNSVVVYTADIDTFYNYMVAFRGYTNIDSIMASQMMEVIDNDISLSNIKQVMVCVLPSILITDAHLLLKYIVETNRIDIAAVLRYYYTIWRNCAEYLYSYESTRDSLKECIRRMYNSNAITKNNTDKFIRICEFVIDHDIEYADTVISAMISRNLDISVIESFIVRYRDKCRKNVAVYHEWRPDDKRYCKRIIDICMKYFDQYEVFKSLAEDAFNRKVIEKIYKKYDIANKIAYKLKIEDIHSIDITIYLMMQGVCDFVEDKFWDKFYEDEYSCREYLENIDENIMRFLYENSNCSICLNINLVNACDNSSDISRQALLYLHEYPQKLCDRCCGAKKLKNS
jgi:hypothetical protein